MYLAKVRMFFSLAKPHRKFFAKIFPAPHGHQYHHHYPTYQHVHLLCLWVEALLDNEVPAEKMGPLVRLPIG